LRDRTSDICEDKVDQNELIEKLKLQALYDLNRAIELGERLAYFLSLMCRQRLSITSAGGLTNQPSQTIAVSLSIPWAPKPQ
jgi:hypothetical protein